MKNFTNVFGTVISHKPFFHTAANVWRVARFEDDVLDIVFENKGFKTKEACQKHIDKLSENQAYWILNDALNS